MTRWSSLDNSRAEQDQGWAEFTSNDLGLVRAVVLAGAGIGMMPCFLAEQDVLAGTLVQVLPDQTLPLGHLRLLWPETRHLAPRVRALIDHTVAFWRESPLFGAV